MTGLTMERVAIVTGSRNWRDMLAVMQALDEFAPALVVNGGCPTGADRMARSWCDVHEVPCLTWYAAWNRHGRSAGPIRNTAMLTAFPSATVLAFPLPGGRGTQHCVKQAQRMGMPVIITNP